MSEFTLGKDALIAELRLQLAASRATLDALRDSLTEVLNLPDHRMANAWDYRRQVIDKARAVLASSRRP